MPKLTVDDLKKMRESARKDIHLREGNFRGKVIVHMGTCGIAAGARPIMSAFIDAAGKAGVTDIMFTTSGCAGLCSEEPMITVQMADSAPVKYGKLTPEKALRIFEEHVMKGRIVGEIAMGIGSERAG